MSGSIIKSLGRMLVFVTAVVLLAVTLPSLDAVKLTVNALSLKHIEEIVAQSGEFHILEIVPDAAAASLGYYIDGQEPIAGWRTTLGETATPAARISYANSLFGRLADKGVLGGAGATPLRYTYQDGTSYYTEAYLPADPQNWSVLQLRAPETVTLTGTMTAQEGGSFRGAFEYTPMSGGGYVQNIRNFTWTETPAADGTAFYYNPVFLPITPGSNLNSMLHYTVYELDANGHYYADPAKLTVQDYVNSGGFDISGFKFEDPKTYKYFYVDPAMTGAPGEYNYAAVPDNTDNDDAPGDGFTSAPAGGVSYFSRAVESYAYVADGGNYAYSATGSGVYTATFSSVYYKGGFINNNLFKQQVFGLDADHMNALGVSVAVRPAPEVTADDIAAADLIYLSSGTDITNSGAATSYTGSCDIPDAQAVRIYNYAAGNLPLIIDHSIIAGIAESTPPAEISNIEKLSLLCLQPSLTPTAGTSLSVLTVGWPALAYMTGDADRTFVNNNVYCFSPFDTDSLGGTPNVLSLVTAFWGAPYSAQVVSDGFSAVLTEIQNENFLRQIAAEPDRLPENVTVSAAVRHIINYKGHRELNAKTAIKVLDLEPAKVTAATWLTESKVLSWLPPLQTGETYPAVTVVHMTTGEFIGKIDDIVETYDMIYIGMSFESLNTDGTGKTVYNDTTMNGLVYSNIGDIYRTTLELAGIRSLDYLTVDGVNAINGTSGTKANQFRFSGNDITASKVAEFRKFAQAGYPIILGGGFMNGTLINTGKVDCRSYMYQAVNQLLGLYPNVMSEQGAADNKELVKKHLNVSKPAISLTFSPNTYVDQSSAPLSGVNDGYKDDDESNECNNHRYLKYEFSVKNVTDPTPVSTTYDCRLYIDSNADGRYTDGEELNDIEIRRVPDNGGEGALVLPLTDGKQHEYYALSAGTKYAVLRQMPDEYVGIVPWKLEIFKNDAAQIHASAQGFTRIAAGDAYQTIRVLQIMQNGTSGTKLNLASQLTPNPAGTNLQLRGDDGKYYTGIYGKLIADLDDFRVLIDVIETDDLENKKTVNGSSSSTNIFDYLNGYDMLIIGFNDCYDGIGAYSAPAIVSYIESGKSVLFTHDTTSLTQVAPNPAHPGAYPLAEPVTAKTLANTDVIWNAATTQYKSVDGRISFYGAYQTKPANLKGTSYTVAGTFDGIRTYTISGQTYYQSASLPFPQKVIYNGNPDTGTTQVLTWKAGSITDWGYYFNTVIRDYVGLDRYGVTNPLLKGVVDIPGSMNAAGIQYVLDNSRSVAFTPGSPDTAITTVPEYQGYTNYALIRFGDGSSAHKYTNNTYTNRETTNISQVNKGQITTYPYNLNTASFAGSDSAITAYGGSYMKIGKTHEQYFQINMNTDDIVVWYCMSNYSSYTNGVISYDTSSYYDDVPNDCVNAYYIYNKGNVTYSGVGHSSDASLYTGASIAQEYINEAKLFVNTMIAAYQSTPQDPTVAIKQDARGTSDLREKTLLVDIGNNKVLEKDLSPTDESRAVYYRITDPSVGANKTISVSYYVADPAGAAVGDIPEKVTELKQAAGSAQNLVTYNADGTAASSLKGGYVYKFYLPDGNCLDRLIDNNAASVTVYVKVTTTIGTAVKEAWDSIIIKNHQLYALS